MSWKFDAFKVELVWVESAEINVELMGDIDMGSFAESDIAIDMGDRSVDTSRIDQGLRVYDGDI